MHIRNLDLNLLVVAAALYRHKNVSKAAADLGLSQSAVSHALTRLRDQFKDPLFVRTAKGMAPTEYARKIQAELFEIIHRTELLATRHAEFLPLEVDSRISIASTDYFEILVMPKLEEILAKEAPNLQISLRPTRGELPKRELEEGVIDLAVAGFYRDLPEGFFQSKLYTDHFLCAAGAKHPSFKSKEMSRDKYYELRHALITLQGDFRDTDRESKSPKRKRKIVYGSYSFTGMAWVLQSPELLLTAPSLLLKEYKKYFPIQIWPCPIERPNIDIRMVWHAQTHEDRLRKWLRGKIKGVCAELQPLTLRVA